MWNVELLRKEPKGLSLLMSGYKAVGELSPLNSELIYLVEPLERLKYLEEAKVEESLLAYDNFLLNSNQPQVLEKAKIGLLNSLKNSGLEFILKNSNFLSEKENSAELKETMFKHAWKLGLWEKNEPCLDSKTGFNQNVFSLLHSFVNAKEGHETNLSRMMQIIDETKLNVLEEANESSVAAQTLLTVRKLYTLGQLRKFALSRKNQSESEYLKIERQMLIHEMRNFSSTFQSFELFDDLLNLRGILAESIFKCEKKKEEAQNFLSFIYDELSNNAIAHRRFQVLLFFFLYAFISFLIYFFI